MKGNSDLISIDDLPFINEATKCKIIESEHSDSEKIFFKRGVFANSDGSAYVEYGHTKIICKIFGPLELKSDMPLLHASVRCAPFDQQNSSNQHPITKSAQQQLLHNRNPAIDLIQFADFLQNALMSVIVWDQLGGRSRLELHVQIIQAASELQALAAAVTACSLALLDASLPIHDIAVGAALEEKRHQKRTQTTETNKKLPADKQRQLCAVIAAMPSLNQICNFRFENSTNQAVDQKIEREILIGSETTTATVDVMDAVTANNNALATQSSVEAAPKNAWNASGGLLNTAREISEAIRHQIKLELCGAVTDSPVSSDQPTNL